jgi:DNA-binding XRE family transcriptional regulator
MDDSGRHVKVPGGDGALTPRPSTWPRRGLPVAIDGDALRSRRRAARLTQTQVADAAGVSGAYICLLEQNRNNPGIDIVRSLADILGCQVSDLRRDEAA